MAHKDVCLVVKRGKINKLLSMNGHFCCLNDRFLEESAYAKAKGSDDGSLTLSSQPKLCGVKIYNYVNTRQSKNFKGKLENKLRDGRRFLVQRKREASLERNPKRNLKVLSCFPAPGRIRFKRRKT